MSAQDAVDIVQMNSLSGGIPVSGGGKKKSGLLWIVLGCMIVGVGLGVFVYQQSLSTSSKPMPTPKASRAPIASPSTIAPIAPVPPTTNEVTTAGNTVNFPKKGKLRIYHTLNNVQLVLQIVINGSTKSITLPAKGISTATPMNFADSSFEVEAGSTGTVTAFLNSTSGPQLKGWVDPMDMTSNKKECGTNNQNVANNELELAYVNTKLLGENIFEYQCWEDDDEPGEYNDLYMLWTYAPASATPTPSAVSSPSPSATASVSPSPSVRASTTPTPSPSVKASSVATAVTPTPSPRVSMPDTTEGVPVTGVFEITVGTVSVGLILLVLGLFGLLSL